MGLVKDLEEISLRALNSLLKTGDGEMRDLVVVGHENNKSFHLIDTQEYDFFCVGKRGYVGGVHTFRGNVNGGHCVPVIYGVYVQKEDGE